MMTFKTFTAAILTLMALTAPTCAQADDRHYDHRNDSARHFDHKDHRYDRNDRGWNRNYSENQRYWNGGHDHDRWYGSNNGYDRNYHYVQPRNVIIVGRQRPYDYAPSYSGYTAYNRSGTIIYGDGNLIPLGSSSSYYYRNR